MSSSGEWTGALGNDSQHKDDHYGINLFAISSCFIDCCTLAGTSHGRTWSRICIWNGKLRWFVYIRQKENWCRPPESYVGLCTLDKRRTGADLRLAYLKILRKEETTWKTCSYLGR